MSQNDNSKTTVIDAGGRYGMHSSWRRFNGDINYIMFEPDVDEARRLALKYESNKNITVVPKALGEKSGELKLQILKHHGLSSVFSPNKDSFCFKNSRPDEVEVETTRQVPVTTIDLYCKENSLNVDFMKVDTEGCELSVLKGAVNQIENSILGMRCEAMFDKAFIGASSVADIYNYLTEKDYLLVNMDYSGQGSAYNEYFIGNKYGAVIATDTVWIMHPDKLFSKIDMNKTTAAIKVSKCAAFCMANNASDLAMHFLLEAKQKHHIDVQTIKNTALFKGLDISVQYLFNALFRHPAYQRDKLQEVYKDLFGRSMKLYHNFFESDEINPT